MGLQNWTADFCTPVYKNNKDCERRDHNEHNWLQDVTKRSTWNYFLLCNNWHRNAVGNGFIKLKILNKKKSFQRQDSNNKRCIIGNISTKRNVPPSYHYLLHTVNKQINRHAACHIADTMHALREQIHAYATVTNQSNVICNWAQIT